MNVSKSLGGPAMQVSLALLDIAKRKGFRPNLKLVPAALPEELFAVPNLGKVVFVNAAMDLLTHRKALAMLRPTHNPVLDRTQTAVDASRHPKPLHPSTAAARRADRSCSHTVIGKVGGVQTRAILFKTAAEAETYGARMQSLYPSMTIVVTQAAGAVL